MPKKYKRLVYGGPAEEFTRTFSDDRKVKLEKGVATIVDEDIFNILMNGSKTNNFIEVTDYQQPYARKLMDRIIREKE